VHIEKIKLPPTENLEFGFQRTVIWAARITSQSIFTPSCVVSSASRLLTLRQVQFRRPWRTIRRIRFSYRLPKLEEMAAALLRFRVHDDISPVDAPRRASWRPGIYLSHVPLVPKLDVRVEGARPNPPVSRSLNGQFMYFEAVQRQGYTTRASSSAIGSPSGQRRQAVA